MKPSGLLLFLSLSSQLSAQNANEAVLTFIDEAGKNDIAVNLNVSGIGASNAVSTISGTMTVRVNIAPETATTDELTILSADAGGTNVNLSARNSFIANYDLDAEDIRFTITTPVSPGIVTPATGEFEASQYQATTTQGTVTGSADTLLTDPQSINFNLGTTPFFGTGQGTGTITVTPGRIEGRRLYFDLSVTLPVGISGSTVVPDVPITITADFAFGGTVEATGETFLEYPDYATWATGLNLATESQNDFDLQSDVPNYLYFALGFDDESPPGILFEESPAGVTLKTGSTIALDDLEIQWSDDLVTWVTIPQNAMVTGSSQMTFGDDLSEPPTIQLTDQRKFLRLAQPTQP